MLSNVFRIRCLPSQEISTVFAPSLSQHFPSCLPQQIVDMSRYPGSIRPPPAATSTRNSHREIFRLETEAMEEVSEEAEDFIIED